MQKLDYAGIGMRIRKARKKKGLTQGVLAKECGICLSFMGHIERGTRCMSLETFAQICRILDTDADRLLFGIDHVPDTVLDLWNLSDKREKKTAAKQPDSTEDGETDSYAMYLRIMKSVAEIMNKN